MAEVGGRIAEMSKEHFRKAILVLNKSPDTAKQIARFCLDKLRELDVEPNLDNPFRGTNATAATSNTASVIGWIQSITAADKKAIEQLVVLHATAVQKSK